MKTKINTEQICNAYIHLKTENSHYNYSDEVKWLGIIWRKGGFRDWWSNHIVTQSAIENNNNSYCENNVVYYKPHIDLRMNGDSTITKFFDTEDELNEFVQRYLSSQNWIYL